MSLSLATLDAVGRMKLDPVLRRTGAGELGTDTTKCAVCVFHATRKVKKRKEKKKESIIAEKKNKTKPTAYNKQRIEHKRGEKNVRMRNEHQ